MFVFGLLAALVAFVNAGVPMHDGRIVGGIPTTIEKYPHQVSLELTNNGYHFCGGSIYSEKYVITAGHCVAGKIPSQIKVRVGTTQRETAGQVFSLASIKSLPGFNMSALDGDVAILQLADSITFGPKAQPIKLVPENKAPRRGEMVTVSGWGTLRSGDSGLPPVLQVVRVPVIDRNLCGSVYSGFKITEKMTCAGVSKKDSCQGDSGGPLINDKKELVGIVSFGEGCGKPGYPGVYANVANPIVRNFILENTQ